MPPAGRQSDAPPGPGLDQSATGRRQTLPAIEPHPFHSGLFTLRWIQPSHSQTETNSKCRTERFESFTHGPVVRIGADDGPSLSPSYPSDGKPG